jgi:serine/threonine-protein kinase
MRSQIMFDVPAGLSVDEVKQIFQSLSDDPSMRPHARRMRFFNPVALTTSQAQIPRERLPAGAPLGRSVAESFQSGAQSLLVTFCTNAADGAGRLYPLTKPTMTLGRRSEEDIVLPEATVSGAHAEARWQNGTWVIEDKGSTNGTYADHSFERKKSVNLMHGGEVQLGECRVKLVSFTENSPHHERACAYLSKRDGLTGLFRSDQFNKALAEEVAFAEWNNVPLSVARYQIRGPTRHDLSPGGRARPRADGRRCGRKPCHSGGGRRGDGAHCGRRRGERGRWE